MPGYRLTGLFDIVGRVGKYALRLDDDCFDRLNHHYSVVLLVVCCIVVGTRQYVGDTIICLPSAHFPEKMIEYVNQMCWLNGTYYLPRHLAPLQEDEERVYPVVYYQWITMILLLQAMLFISPSILWKICCGKNGLDVNRLVVMTSSLENVNPDVRERTIKYMVSHIDRFLKYQKYAKTGACSRRLKAILRYCCFIVCGRGYGNYTVGLFLFCKLLYLLNSVGQMWLLSILLGMDYPTFGVDFISAVVDGRLKEFGSNSRVFPRETMCDVWLRQFSNVHRHTFQCALPVNMFTEKIYIVIWFWLILVSVSNLIGMTFWLWNMFHITQVQYIKRFLKIMERVQGIGYDKMSVREFTEDYLKHDGVFSLRLLANNTNDVVMAEIFGGLWESFKGVQRKYEGSDLGLQEIVCNGEKKQYRPSAPPPSPPHGPSRKKAEAPDVKALAKWKRLIYKKH